MFTLAERTAIAAKALEDHLRKHPEDKGKVAAYCRQGSNPDGSPHVWLEREANA
jgi:hypothetical protein